MPVAPSPRDAEVLVLKDGSTLVVAPGVTVTRRAGDEPYYEWEGHETVPGGGSSAWHRDIEIGPGDAELVDARWLASRNADGGPLEIRTKTTPVYDGRGKDVTIRVGERVNVGDWTITWRAVERPWWNQVRERVYTLAATRAGYRDEPGADDPVTGDPTVWWVHPDKTEPRVHDLVTPDKLFAVEVTVTSLTVHERPTEHAMVVRAREVDRARAAKYGAPLAEGLHAFDDGLRVHFALMSACAQNACGQFEATASLGSARHRFYLDPTMAPERWSGRTFTLKAAHMAVTR